MSIEENADEKEKSKYKNKQNLVNATVTLILIGIPWVNFPKEIIFIFPFAVHHFFSLVIVIYDKYIEDKENKKEKNKQLEITNSIQSELSDSKELLKLATCSAEIDFLQNKVIALHKEKDQESKAQRDRMRQEAKQFRENRNAAKDRQSDTKNEIKDNFHAGVQAVNEQLNDK